MSIESIYSKFQECNFSVSTDTRKNVQDSLFFCLNGENFDGNTFAQKAFDNGAKYIIIDNPAYQSVKNTILVDNSLETLQKLANFHRKKLATPIIAITGSNGKTTSKELIFSILNQSFHTIATLGNLNNHIGVPLTLLSIKPSTEIAIVEMGANHPNEIAFLCQIAEPDFGYITNFGKAHLEGFLSIEGVIKAKCELYEYLIAHQKTIFFNQDNLIQTEKLQNYPNIFSFSVKNNNSANIIAQIVQSFPFVSIKTENTTIHSYLTGVYNADNIVAAICVGRYFKISYEAIKKGIENYIPSNSRSQIIEKANGNKLLLDAYNANPSSMQVAIDNFKQIEYPNKIVILGDMKELGTESHFEHQQIVTYLENNVWKEVLLVGENFGNTSNNYKHFKSTDDVLSYLEKQHYTDTFFLIKGSRAMKLEQIVAYFE